SLQTLELSAVCWALANWDQEPLNIVSDSLYVVGVVQRIEDSILRCTTNPRLGQLFQQLQRIVGLREHPYCIIHVRSHLWDKGLGEGNARADAAVSWVVHQPPVNLFDQARNSHSFFHQNAKALRKQFKLSHDDARGIVRACPQCSHHGLGLGLGVNPRGLRALEIWQMDVTHFSEFGRLKYVHVTVDTFSKFIWATAQTGEKASHVKRHLTACFAIMGVPEKLKTDNGPAYCSSNVKRFLSTWGVTHITGITNSPTGQAIIERSHRVLKEYLKKQ
ncbi:hypothetical protein N340_12039, partial [Tauraco erythrolophus]